jgi:formylglycine-generating enzyme required for sulfatase activity
MVMHGRVLHWGVLVWIAAGAGSCEPPADVTRLALSSEPSVADAGATDAGGPPIAWVRLPGGTYTMGAATAHADMKPPHPVTLSSFEVAVTEATTGQYRACHAEGGCPTPSLAPGCTVQPAADPDLPASCLTWTDARAFCAWAGGRLCSEAEWEYAATGAGRAVAYPWGATGASCDLAVLEDNGHDGCGQGTPWPVCSKPSGVSPQGLCDLAGNLWEWVEDCYQGSYEGAPSDGGARTACDTDGGTDRVVRGSSYGFKWSHYARSAYRYRFPPDLVSSEAGVRCCR